MMWIKFDCPTLVSSSHSDPLVDEVPLRIYLGDYPYGSGLRVDFDNIVEQSNMIADLKRSRHSGAVDRS
jgi:hypothetical protein